MIRPVKDFYNNEYKQQAANANFTKIANIFGLKVTANKVIHTVLQKKIKNWTKVEVLSSMTALETIYMGGSSNIDGVIVNISAGYVGANNLPLLSTKGSFGSRLKPVPAASRYIFVKEGDVLDKYFNKDDLNILPRYNFEGEDIEYQFFTFNIPLIIVNGTEGIGSGHSSLIMPTEEEKVLEAVKLRLKGSLNIQKLSKLLYPSFRGFTGIVKQGDSDRQWIITGSLKRITKTKTEITEVPIGETYKSFIKKLDSLEESGKIKRYDDLCEPKQDTFKFIIYHDRQVGEKSEEELLNFFKLIKTVSENYTLNDENNKIIKFNSRSEIFEYYYNLRLKYLQKRKDYLIKKYSQDLRELVSKYVFVKAIVDETLIITKRPDEDIIKDLDGMDKIVKVNDSYDYLLNMNIRSLTQKKMDELMKKIKNTKDELDSLKETTLEQMWLNDLK